MMKIRNGFVSNSSSTSFVLLGWRITKEQAQEYVEKMLVEPGDEDWIDAIYEDDGKNGIYRHSEEDEYFLGEMIAESSGGDFDGKEVDFSKVVEKAKEIGKKAGLDNPKLFVGTYAS